MGCTGNKMSVEEAKKVAVSMNQPSFIPPPRHIDDIKEILDRIKPDQRVIKRRIFEADSTPPEGIDKKDLARYYYERGKAANELGRTTQGLSDFQNAVYLAGDSATWDMICDIGWLEYYRGNYQIGIDKIRGATQKFSENVGPYIVLTRMFANLGNLEAAEKAWHKAEQIMMTWPDNTLNKRIWKQLLMSDGNAHILEAKGKWRKAEGFRRSALAAALSPIIFRQKPWIVSNRRTDLSNNLNKQGKLIEAEVEARKALLEALETYGKYSFYARGELDNLSKILIAQGRFEEAESLVRSLIEILETTGVSDESLTMFETKQLLAECMIGQRKWANAMGQFNTLRGIKSVNKTGYNKVFLQNTAYPLVLIKMQEYGKSLKYLKDSYETTTKNFGITHPKSVELLGLIGVTHFETGNIEAALNCFQQCAPSLMRDTAIDGQKESFQATTNQVRKLIIESYIRLLAKIRNTPLELKAKINATEEAFVLADTIRRHTVQKALRQSSTRLYSADSEIADLIRKEQDCQKQINALQSHLSDALANPDQQSQVPVRKLADQIGTLQKAKKALMDEIQERFPRYSDLINPQPTTLQATGAYLNECEALVSIYSSDSEIFIWAINFKGNKKFFSDMVGEKKIGQMVSKLREALDPNPKTLADVPEFNLEIANELYNILLKPVEDSWKDATDLIIVAQGALGQLPFSVLNILPQKLNKKESELFSKYRNVPWLIKKVSITRYSSVSSFITLRNAPQYKADRKAFIGFGDPIFGKNQLTVADKKVNFSKKNRLISQYPVNVRGVRLTESGKLDSNEIVSSNISLLNRLPETAEEIRSMAEATGGDPTRDVFLGRNASEHNVKNVNLADRKVVAFASHALIPGDIDGLSQPAIALSSPAITGNNEDGLLTLDEVLRLKLNADWVILSACNTGAADGAGAEAISGLGRAFFYAGTRAILVSMWPVESTSAKNLTTGIFKYQKANSSISRARALKSSMLELINNGVLRDAKSDKMIASYAHPLFWAPFIIIGDGR